MDGSSGKSASEAPLSPDTRRVIMETECWETNPPRLVDTKVIYEENGRLFLDCVEGRFGCKNPMTKERVMTLQGKEIFVDLIWPFYEDGFEIISTNAQNLYLKKPSPLKVALAEPEVIKRRMLNEIRLCEEVKKCPHPNVVDYRGCLIEENKIKGIYMKRYGDVLAKRVFGNIDFDKKKALADIERGMKHLHSIGIVHGDLSPHNVMFDENNNAVIIDLDSGHHTGDVIAATDMGATKYFGDDFTVALPENDYFSLGRIKLFIEGGMQALLAIE